MRTVRVTINGEPVTIAEKRPRENAAWRKQFEEAVAGPAGFVADVAGKLDAITFESPADLVGFAQQAATTILPAIGLAHELCVAYDARFGDAYESECLDALPEVLTLAYPLGGVLERLTGSSDLSIFTNSPAPNGAGTKTTTPSS